MRRCQHTVIRRNAFIKKVLCAHLAHIIAVFAHQLHRLRTGTCVLGGHAACADGLVESQLAGLGRHLRAEAQQRSRYQLV